MPEHKERMLRWFEPAELRGDMGDLVAISFEFEKLAKHLVAIIPPGPERTVALRKLLESKNAAVRAHLESNER